MKKRNCRKTDLEREQHDRAIRIRKMTDAQLCEYIDGLTQQTSHTKPEEIISNFLDLLTVPTDKGLYVSRMTANKVRQIAEQRGFLAEQKYN
ncbi:MAG: hypothetical protein HFG18_09250 [Oscillospiraceae bacterium]|nr:hypothetical protein [Oscillospiraceae bacterium]MCI9668089.1 hypothetical protein [Oscillospiraceae bacterium]